MKHSFANTTPRITVLAAVLLVAGTLSGCTLDKIMCIFNPAGCIGDKAAEKVEQAIHELDYQSANWQRILNELSSKLASEAQTTVQNEVDNVLSRAVAASGAEFRCNVDYVGLRVKQNLKVILAELRGESAPIIEPGFCKSVPDAIDAQFVPQRLKFLEYYGYDFDKQRITARLVTETAQTDVSRYLDHPTHYHLTLNLVSFADQIKAASNARLAFYWADREQATVAVLPNIPLPTYLVRIRTWDKENGEIGSGGKVSVQFVGSDANSSMLRVEGDYRRGEIESKTFAPDGDLGNIMSAAVEYNDDSSPNAWALDWVEITNNVTGRMWHCAGNIWLGRQNQRSVVLPCH